MNACIEPILTHTHQSTVFITGGVHIISRIRVMASAAAEAAAEATKQAALASARATEAASAAAAAAEAAEAATEYAYKICASLRAILAGL